MAGARGHLNARHGEIMITICSFVQVLFLFFSDMATELVMSRF
jgi:hypothetical protein